MGPAVSAPPSPNFDCRDDVMMSTVERHLTVWVGLQIVIGIAVGWLVPGAFETIGAAEVSEVNLSVAMLVLLMIIPILALVSRPISRHRSTNFAQTFELNGPLSLRKSAIVLCRSPAGRAATYPWAPPRRSRTLSDRDHPRTLRPRKPDYPRARSRRSTLVAASPATNSLLVRTDPRPPPQIARRIIDDSFFSHSQCHEEALRCVSELTLLHLKLSIREHQGRSAEIPDIDNALGRRHEPVQLGVCLPFDLDRRERNIPGQRTNPQHDRT
jgi:hypothetical protein